MRSMTGFGQASVDDERWRIQVTARGVNHRFLDQVLRLPDLCRGEEGEVRRLVSERLARGRVEVAADVVALGDETSQASVRSEVALALMRSAEAVGAEAGIGGDLTLADLLRLPGVVEVEVSRTPWDAEAAALLLATVGGALDQLVEAREREGARLRAIALDKLGDLDRLVEELENLRPGVQEALAEALGTRLETALDAEVFDSERVLQEIALLVERSNIAEELERLAVHLGHLREILDEDGPIGKRLDFLVQEVFRELNTMSAKCRSSEMTRICVDAKVLCEELREQLRNVE